MLLQAINEARVYGIHTQTFFDIIIKCLTIIILIILIYLLIKKVIKPIINYFKTKQDYYAAQTEYLKNEKKRDKG